MADDPNHPARPPQGERHRAPDHVETSAEFDPDLYLALNPDVAELLDRNLIASAEAHWLERGRAEEAAGQRPSFADPRFYYAPIVGRPPSAAEVTSFNPELYLAMNGDVAASGHTVGNAFEHWLQYGRFEGRNLTGPDRFRHRQTRLSALMRRPFGVNLYAPFSSVSGLGTAARGYLRAL